MVKWKLIFTKQAVKDSKRVLSAGLKEKVEGILKLLEENPFKNPPSFEKLTGDLTGAYSRRINIQHRLVYQVYKKRKTIKILRLWTHYE